MLHHENQKSQPTAVTREYIIKLGGIYIENILDGFEQYDCDILEGTSEYILSELKKLQEHNGLSYSYVDFYYGKLKEEEKEKVRNGLSIDSLKVLEQCEVFDNVVYLRLDEDILNLTAELNEKELLFCTYYFCNDPCTVWGNYEMKYPVFRKRSESDDYKR